MKYKGLLLLAFSLFAVRLESAGAGLLLVSREVDQFALQAELLVEGEPCLVLRLTNKSDSQVLYGISTGARGFVCKAKTLNGESIPYSALGRELFKPTIHVSNRTAVIKPLESTEFRVLVADVGGYFMRPPEVLEVTWSRGVDSKGDDHPVIADLVLELDFEQINERLVANPAAR